jgi:hypothetical protein
MSDRSLTAIAVAAGLLLRAWHLAADHTVWYDEAVLLANVLNKGYGQLLGPLEHAVAAPPLFLWLLRLVGETCGDVPRCWRLEPFVCGCALLLVSVPLARRVLPPAAVAPAVALVAWSDNLVWHSVIVKPYSGDALLAALLLYAFVVTDGWAAARRLWWLAAATPFVLGVSYPAMFIVGGLLLALLPDAVKERARPAWLVAAAAAVGMLALLYLGPITAQRVPGLVKEWQSHYPDFARPWTVPWWVVRHTAQVFQFTFNPSGFALFALAPVGMWTTWRAGCRGLVVALVAPFLLAMTAAALKAYPYGFSRLMLFTAPCVLLLGGLGLGAVVRRLPRWWAAALAWGLVGVVMGPSIGHLVSPFPRPDSSAAARFIREHRRPGDRVASDEQTYAYFFRGELLPLDRAAAELPAGGRVWVPMDHYDPDGRRRYVDWKLTPGGLRRTDETVFRLATVFLFVKDAPPP